MLARKTVCTEKWMEENSVGRRNDGTKKQHEEKNVWTKNCMNEKID